ncbi:MAG: CcmD family protein [Coriobacteriia bacterium]|nr:CcmD family protein [Coriobacteriia bacterium]
MDPTNAELYKLVLPDFPYVVAAYGVLWIALIGYVSLVLSRLMKLEKEILVVEESCARRDGGKA